LAYVSTMKVSKGITTLESITAHSREAQSNSCYLVCVPQSSSLIPDGTHDINSVFVALPEERIYDLGPTCNWRILFERPLISTSAPRDFVWAKLNPLMLQRMRTKQIDLATRTQAREPTSSHGCNSRPSLQPSRHY